MAERYKKQNKTTDEVIELLYKTIEEDADLVKIYDNWADQYDKDISATNYTSPEMLANEVACFYGDSDKDIKILDVAAGTGIMGRLLYDRGFKNLDAIDASSKMLEEVEKTGVYKNFYQHIMGPKKVSIPDSTYDLIATTGSFVPGHLTEDCFEELLRLIKTGGHIMIFMSMIYHTIKKEYAEKIESRMLELDEMGQWKLVARKVKEKHIRDTAAVLFIFKKC